MASELGGAEEARTAAVRHRRRLVLVPLVVAVMAPGQVAVSPWAQNASAVLTMFLGGQETGHGWADVLTGAVTPSGKLPVTFVHDDADAQPSGPCMGEESGHCVYGAAQR